MNAALRRRTQNTACISFSLIVSLPRTRTCTQACGSAHMTDRNVASVVVSVSDVDYGNLFAFFLVLRAKKG